MALSISVWILLYILDTLEVLQSDSQLFSLSYLYTNPNKLIPASKFFCDIHLKLLTLCFARSVNEWSSTIYKCIPLKKAFLTGGGFELVSFWHLSLCGSMAFLKISTRFIIIIYNNKITSLRRSLLLATNKHAENFRYCFEISSD